MRTAIVGLGWWGQALAEAARRVEVGISVAAGWSPDAVECATFARRFGCRRHDSFAAVLADRSIDGVILATPHSLHPGQIMAAAAAGKHVFVEKPLALTAGDARAAVHSCRTAGVVLAVGHNRRLLAQYQLLTDLIARGKCGQLLHVEANFSTPEALGFPAGHWRTDRAECPGGAMTVLGIHVIDWLHGLFGSIVRVNGRFARHAVTTDMDDTASALLVFESGLTATLTCLYAAPYANYFAVNGSEARVEVSADAPETATVRPRMRLVQRDGTGHDIPVPYVDTLNVQLERWALACVGRGQVAVGGIEAARHVAVLDAIVRSAGADGAAVVPDYGDLRPREPQ